VVGLPHSRPMRAPGATSSAYPTDRSRGGSCTT
jgi:hypothetical protein